MASKTLNEAMRRVESWPEAAQEELAEIALEIDARLKHRHYHATREELVGIDRGLEGPAKVALPPNNRWKRPLRHIARGEVIFADGEES